MFVCCCAVEPTSPTLVKDAITDTSAVVTLPSDKPINKNDEFQIKYVDLGPVYTVPDEFLTVQNFDQYTEYSLYTEPSL